MYDTATSTGLGKLNVNIGATIAPQQPIGRVTEGYEQARKLVEAVHQEIAQLEARIDSVLRPTGPSGANGASEKQRVEPSALGAGIETLNAQLYNVLGYVQSLSARVDL